MIHGGFIAYEGPSLLDGQPIVAIVTTDSVNSKTGHMAQAWILRADLDVQQAILSGADASICGHCPHRSGTNVGRSCYVVTWLGPLNVYRAFAAGKYDAPGLDRAARRLVGKAIRLAAYGDPAAVPTAVWRQLLDYAAGWTGYTHQWRTCDQRLRAYCMASVESPSEALEAMALGWRSFRVRRLDEPVGDEEIVCPASAEAGHRLTCETCKLCVGTARPGARNVAIVVHGQRARWFDDRETA